MNALTKTADLAQSTAIPAPTRKDLLETIANVFERAGEKTFKAIPDIEYKSNNVIAAIPTTDTIMQVAVDTLNVANVPTEPNLGSVMQNLDLTKDDVHGLACVCKGDDVPGTDLAQRFRDAARYRA